MPNPARTTTLSLNFLGLHAAPSRGASPHCRPVSVVLLTPFVGYSLLLPAMMNPFDVMVSVASSYTYCDGSKLKILPYFSVSPPSQSKRNPAVRLRFDRI